jgi:hypothetical protein
MGMFAFKRLRELEAASLEVASFSIEQSEQPQEPPAQTRRPRARKVKPDGTQ